MDKNKGRWILKLLLAGCPPVPYGQGYGAFSVNPIDVDTVIAYIENQKEHHQKRTFQDEYRALLKKYEVKYDERYVWD